MQSQLAAAVLAGLRVDRILLEPKELIQHSRQLLLLVADMAVGGRSPAAQVARAAAAAALQHLLHLLVLVVLEILQQQLHLKVTTAEDVPQMAAVLLAAEVQAQQRYQ